MSYTPNIKILFLKNNLSNNTINMQPINGLIMNLEEGWYEAEFCPLYDVPSTTIGTGWGFQAGTALISNYTFSSESPSTTSANYYNNYSTLAQNYTTIQSPRQIDNRASIKVTFKVNSGGTLIPRFRSELNGNLVTLKVGSYIKLTRLF